jgi:hypothetical protein
MGVGRVRCRCRVGGGVGGAVGRAAFTPIKAAQAVVVAVAGCPHLRVHLLYVDVGWR